MPWYVNQRHGHVETLHVREIGLTRGNVTSHEGSYSLAIIIVIYIFMARGPFCPALDEIMQPQVNYVLY